MKTPSKTSPGSFLEIRPPSPGRGTLRWFRSPPALPMESHPDDRPFSDAHLDSPEYRRRLYQKLNTLIAVLEVACAKVERSLESPSADLDRLERIQVNLNDTLDICRRARRALDRREALPGDLPPSIAQLSPMEDGEEVQDPIEDYLEEEGYCEEDEDSEDIGDHITFRPWAVSLEMSSEEEQRKFDSLGPIQMNEVLSCDLDELIRRLGGVA